MQKRRNGGRKFLALGLTAAVVAGGMLQPLPIAGASEKTENHFKDQVVYRVMDEQTGGIWHYHYEDAEGNEVEPGAAVRQKSHSRRKAAKVSDLPDHYDPRGTEEETPIRDQMDTGTCWAFGALKSLEGNAIAQGLYTVEDADFSENHLAWYTYQSLQDSTNPLYGDYWKASGQGFSGNSETVYDQGGNALMAAFTLANGWGAVEETEAPFASGAEMAEAMEPLGDTIREHSAMRLTSVECYDETSLDEVKQAVLDNKAVDVSVYYPITSEEEENLMYQDEGTCSLYNNIYGIEEANHCVTIVGWDDNYNTFTQQPEQSGAWLIANSYGEEYNDGGYFWVSYYDTSLCDYFTFQGVSADTYSQTFQYDGMGWGSYLHSDQDIRFANVFTNETDQPQELSAAAFYTMADSQSYEVQVYRNLKTGGPLDGEWVGRCTTEGTAGYAGYHTVSLQQPIIVAPGERFSVVVTFHPDGEEAYVPVEGGNSRESDVQYSSREGQSYLFLAEEGQWHDSVEEDLNNVCLKTLANPVTEEAYEEQEKTYEPSIPTTEPDNPIPTTQPASQPDATVMPAGAGNGSTAVNQGSGNAATGGSNTHKTVIGCSSKITMGVREKVKLRVSVCPKQSVTYQSSNTKVASVKKNGMITGAKTGTAKITVSASGTRKKVTVRVKKAPRSIRLTANKKTLKKGKSCKLKVRFSKNSTSYSLKYKSMNSGIATVSSDGKVKAKKPGTVRIQVRSFNGKKAYTKIKVVA